MKTFKFKTEIRGLHVHVAVFVLNAAGNTYQNAGYLVFDEWQWEIFKKGFGAEIERVEARP